MSRAQPGKPACPTPLNTPESLHLDIWRTGSTSSNRFVLRLTDRARFISMGSASDFIQRQIDSNLGEASSIPQGAKRYQEHTRHMLSQDPFFEQAIAPEVLSYHRDLIAVWDFFSLELCRGRVNEFRLPAVPVSETRQVDLLLRGRADRETLGGRPRPFSVESLTTVCEARVLDQRFKDQKRMRQALQKRRPLPRYNFASCRRVAHVTERKSIISFVSYG